MKPYLTKTPRLVSTLFSNQTWGFSNSKKHLYLTFDDGPTPEVTEWVLTTLQQFNAEATFFCIGKNIEENPKLFKKIIEKNHSIGNHTYNHLNGWKTESDNYIDNVLKTESLLNTKSDYNQSLKLFRPPYGKLKSSQTKLLLQNEYTIIMWSVLSADFDASITANQCLNNVIKNTANGSIIVFHDSIKAFEKLKIVLPKVLNYFTEKGFEFKKIEKASFKGTVVPN